MKYIDWNEEKNHKLKHERGVCFEDVLIAIDAGKVLDDIRHPNFLRYSIQRVLIVEIDNYAFLVPYVEDEEKVFLKTVIPSRKMTKRYLKGDEQ